MLALYFADFFPPSEHNYFNAFNAAFSHFATTKTLFKYPTLVHPRNTVIVGFILSSQRASGGDREGICWISLQCDEGDNRSAACAKDTRSFSAPDFKKCHSICLKSIFQKNGLGDEHCCRAAFLFVCLMFWISGNPDFV